MPRVDKEAIHAISDTGPLISAFQSDSFGLLTKIFSQVLIPVACKAELQEHGWTEELIAASPRLRTVESTATEAARSIRFATQVAEHFATKDRTVESHLGEAAVIVLALRAEHRGSIVLIDELAARDVAQKAGLTISGFPGVLLLAARGGLISAEDLRTRLETCRRQGNHYAKTLIQKVYEMAKQGRR